MQGQPFFILISLVLSVLFSWSALAAELSGKTADGCSYKVINGQYMTSCPSKQKAEPASLSQDQVSGSSSAPVTSYSDVPVRQNSAASAPALAPQPALIAPQGSVSSAFEKSDGETSLDQFEEARRNRLRNKMIDQTYAGVTIGASNMKESNTGSTAAVGLNIGTSLDETFGVELGWSYANQKLNMGLASRGIVIDPSGQVAGPIMPSNNDASLSTHLFTGELQAHLTDPLKRLRPYLGAGLGWRAATLSENEATYTNAAAYGQPVGGGSLHQDSLGGLLSVGSKLRVARALQLGFAFRYFFPFTRQDARVEQPVGAYPSPTPTVTKLSAADDSLTGSSQYQMLGGVQYSF